MNTETATPEQNRSEDQARAQLATLIEMVRALELETAAEDHVETLTREQHVALLNEYHQGEVDYSALDDETIAEELAELITEEEIRPPDFEWDEDAARQAIDDDPLSVEIRSGWQSPGQELEPDEYCLLLCTGGPAVRIIGGLDQHCQPMDATIQHQDWFTGWTALDTTGDESDYLLQYANHFYYGG